MFLKKLGNYVKKNNQITGRRDWTKYSKTEIRRATHSVISFVIFI